MTTEIIKEQEVLGKNFRIYGNFESPLFLAKDVAEWLEIKQSSVMIQSVDDDEKVMNISHTLGGNQEQWFLTENGLYEVLMLSRKPIAKQFKKEVKKILHEIRTTGGYAVPKTFGEALQLAANQQICIERQQAEIAEMKPMADGYKRISESKGLKTIKEVADILGYGEKTYFAMLRDMGILFKENGSNLPKREYISSGYFDVKEVPYKRNGEQCLYSKTYVTAKGLLWLEKKTPVFSK